MRLQNLKILTGTALVVALGAIATSPAIATEMSDRLQDNRLAVASDSNYYTGTVRSIVGDIVTLELSNGDTKQIGLNRLEQGRIGLVPGMRIAVRMVDGRRIVSLAPPVEAVTVARVTRIETITQVERTPRRIELPPPQERPAPVRPAPVEPAPVTIEPVEETTEVEPQPRRPIRALW
ncbi:MAG TPA: hypothetical protein DCY88_33140 [Cyanobacteria bacterium UBA11372]|nr:hypothetical protein [Cyanobacteria bacterium UBA11372]